MAETPISELEARLAAASEAPVNMVERIDALNQLAWELRVKDVPRSHAMAGEARELSIAHRYPLGQARAARTMAMTVENYESVERVFPLAEEAKRLFDLAGDGPGRAGSRDFLASIHEFVGDLGVGLEHALDALSIAREINDPVRQGYALSSVGGILAASGEIHGAVGRLEEALQLFRSVDDVRGIGTIASRLARILKKAGRHEEALKYTEICRDLAEKTGDIFLQWATASVMGEIEADRGNPEEAERLYRAAVNAFGEEETGRDLIGAETIANLGRLLVRRGALADAEAELVPVLKRIESNPVSVLAEVTLNDVMSELREKQGELQAAIDHLRKSQALREQIVERDARAKLAQVEIRAAMEAARKDAELHRIRFTELRGKRSGRRETGGPQLGNYELIDRIAEGGMGEVWRAQHPMLGRSAAVKMIRKETAEKGAADSEGMLRRFEREARATSMLKSPHTVEIYDFGITTDGTFFYVMEMLDGIGLDTLVNTYGPVPASRVVYILRQVCDSLAEAHRAQLTHRDIKPGNILLCRYGLKRDFTKVVDFGLVKNIPTFGKDPGLTDASAVVGTPAFMPPEFAQSDNTQDARSDIYALGCVGYWLLTGTLVFEAKTPMAMVLAHVGSAVEPPTSRTELDIPPDLERVIMRCLEKIPADRPQSAEELSALLGECALGEPWTDQRAAEWWNVHSPTTLANSTQGATLMSVPRSDSPPPRSMSPRVWLGVAALVLVVIGLVVALATR